jgi:probable F420-dependent oxidoreductase
VAARFKKGAPMKFEMQLYPLGRWRGLADIAATAAIAEDLGFEAVLIPSHVAVPHGPTADMIGTVWPDNFVIASYLAAATTRIRLHFAALLVPYYHPVWLARALATIDQASQGRVDVTVGTGWFEEEFQALQVPFRERGRITDEYVAIMRGLWANPTFEYHGEYVSFPSMASDPRCYQAPHIPLWIGGKGTAARRRVAEYGAGWTTLTGSLDELAAEISAMRESVAVAARDPRELRFGYHMGFGRPDRAHDVAASKAADADQSALFAASPGEAIDLVHRCSEAGLTHLELTTDWTRSEELVAVMRTFSAEVMAKL